MGPQSWERDNTSATTWPCFQATKLFLLQYYYMCCGYYIETPRHKYFLNFFWSPRLYYVSRCHCREAKKWSRAQPWVWGVWPIGHGYREGGGGADMMICVHKMINIVLFWCSSNCQFISVQYKGGRPKKTCFAAKKCWPFWESLIALVFIKLKKLRASSFLPENYVQGNVQYLYLTVGK